MPLAGAQFGHHTLRLIIEPLRCADAIESKSGPDRQALATDRTSQRLLQIAPEARHQPLQPLLQRQQRIEAAAIQGLDQAAQPAGLTAKAQITPPTLGSEGLPPALHLLSADPRWGWRWWWWLLLPGAIAIGPGSGTGTATLALEQLQTSAQLLQLAAQGLILGQQGLDIAGDPLG